MQEIVEWLRGVELVAFELYSAGAESERLSASDRAFLAQLAEDEQFHFHLMGSALVALREMPEAPAPAVAIDDGLRQRVERPLADVRAKMRAGNASMADIAECIVRTEFCEWNDLFLYVVWSFQRRSRVFQKMAASIQQHEDRIERYLEALPSGQAPAAHLNQLPRIWQHRYLVVDDDDAIRGLFERLFRREAQVVTAPNGQEALACLRDSFFNVVISDLDMPAMNGIDFFRQASLIEQDLGRRFIFCSGRIEEDALAFCREQGIRHIQKPVRIGDLRALVRQTLQAAG